MSQSDKVCNNNNRKNSVELDQNPEAIAIKSSGNVQGGYRFLSLKTVTFFPSFFPFLLSFQPFFSIFPFSFPSFFITFQPFLSSFPSFFITFQPFLSFFPYFFPFLPSNQNSTLCFMVGCVYFPIKMDKIVIVYLFSYFYMFFLLCNSIGGLARKSAWIELFPRFWQVFMAVFFLLEEIFPTRETSPY